MTQSTGIVDSKTMELSISGLRIAARATGSGDPVLLLNGMSRPMASWAFFADALQDRTVIAFDAPGVGASETPVVPYSMPMLADIAARVLDAVGIAKADVVGYSHGGAVAQQFAVGHRARVNRLVLLATACGSRTSPRSHPTVADAKSRNAVATPASVGLAVAARRHLDLVQHPGSRRHRCTDSRGLRRLRQGRPAREQQAARGAHPRCPPCHGPSRTRSAEACIGGRGRPPGAALSRLESFDAATRMRVITQRQRPQFRPPAHRSTRDPQPTRRSASPRRRAR